MVPPFFAVFEPFFRIVKCFELFFSFSAGLINKLEY